MKKLILFICLLASSAMAKDPFSASQRQQTENVPQSDEKVVINQCGSGKISALEHFKIIGVIGYSDRKQGIFLTQEQQVELVKEGEYLIPNEIKLDKIEQGYFFFLNEKCPDSQSIKRKF